MSATFLDKSLEFEHHATTMKLADTKDLGTVEIITHEK